MSKRVYSVVALMSVLQLACATTSGQSESDAAASTEASESDATSETDEGGSEADESVEPSGPPTGFSEAEVMDVVSTHKGSAVVLESGDGETGVPIFIGRSQALAIKLRLERRQYTRPLTHDLLDEVVEAFDGEVRKVHIDAIKSGVFVGTVFIDGPDATHEFDARSSDAIAIAVGQRVPIYVAESVFEEAGVPIEQFEDRGPRQSPESPPPGDESSEDKPEQSPYF